MTEKHMTEKEQFLKNLGANVRYYRQLNHMSQEELGNRCGYTKENARSSIYRIETGQNDITASRLKKLASVFGISPLELMNGTPDKENEENEFLHTFQKFQKLSPENQKFVANLVDKLSEIFDNLDSQKS